MRYIQKYTEKYFQKSPTDNQDLNESTLSEVIEACLVAVSLTCRDKVIKVFNVALHLMNTVI